MNWMLIAALSYFFGALATILDKFLLGSKRVGSAPVYAFYIALVGMAVVFLVPFGFYLPGLTQIVVSLLAGGIFALGLLLLYFAIQKGEASRVAPVVGAVTPLAAFLFSLFFSNENLGFSELLGLTLLVLGGLVISFDLPLKINKRKFFAGFYYAIASGVVLAFSYSLTKEVYDQMSFINGFIWTRFGSFLGALGLLFVPTWRRAITASFGGFRKPKVQHYQTGALFMSNKLCGGFASFLLNYSISLGSVTLINSMVSLQYAFVLILASLAALYYPKEFMEKLSVSDWMQKIVAIAIIAGGIYLITIN